MKKRTASPVLFALALSLALSVLLSGFLIFAANDAFAFVKSGEEAEVRVEEGEALFSVSRKLRRAGAIRLPLTFCLYTRARGTSSFPAGAYRVSGAMSYEEIRASMKVGASASGE